MRFTLTNFVKCVSHDAHEAYEEEFRARVLNPVTKKPTHHKFMCCIIPKLLSMEYFRFVFDVSFFVFRYIKIHQRIE